jgi:hypothetical protein
MATALVWHPKATSLFVMGASKTGYQIYRVSKKNEDWVFKSVYRNDKELRNLIVCPRPFITGYASGTDSMAYRLFFGMDNGDKTFRIVSVTEYGKRFYQVIGPKGTFTGMEKMAADAEPSTIAAKWALPVAFHPGGHVMIWKDLNGRLNCANYDSRAWGGSAVLKIPFNDKGTVVPLPNGLGFIHWQSERPGIGVYMIPENKEDFQLTSYRFISPPRPFPDGKGVVGLTVRKGTFSLEYLPVNIPLPDVQNAWMYIRTPEELELFRKHSGLFRPDQGDQLYKLYETENYYCNDYCRNVPTRPYLVTTDIFWELFGAAYQGLFIVKERDGAMPAFRSFIQAAAAFTQSSGKESKWRQVFAVLNDLYVNNTSNPEVNRIIAEKDCKSAISGEQFSYSELTPRGHYASTPERRTYFKAFRYFTTILKNNQTALEELNNLPVDVLKDAETWIRSYQGLIAPSRAPLVWKCISQILPPYCKVPVNQKTVFPLSWGFDNEVLYSAVYHPDAPAGLQVQGASGPRLLPSGLDIAAAMGNGLAEQLLQSDYEKYPPLRKVIANLKSNFKQNLSGSESKSNIYNQWINAIAIQWADTVNSTNALKDSQLWKTKRLQTGLATWATLRHATVLVNERTAAECGEGGFEEILMQAPRGYVEPDPYTFATIAGLFEEAVNLVPKSPTSKAENDDKTKGTLYDGIVARLKQAAAEARIFQAMAEKERQGMMLRNDENEKILFVAGVAEHLFLVFNSLSNNEYALADPDPMPKITDVAGDGNISPFLMAAVGNTIEWDLIVPFYGRNQIVKGSVYSYYEFESDQLMNDADWRKQVQNQKILSWIKPFVTSQKAEGSATTGY